MKCEKDHYYRLDHFPLIRFVFCLYRQLQITLLSLIIMIFFTHTCGESLIKLQLFHIYVKFTSDSSKLTSHHYMAHQEEREM